TNVHKFVREMNNLYDPMNPQFNRITGALKIHALEDADEGANMLSKMAKTKELASDVVGKVRAANKLYKEHAMEFDPKLLAYQLISHKKGSVAPLIESSQAIKKVLSP